MKKIILFGILLLAISMNPAAYPFSSNLENPFWIEILMNIGFMPLERGGEISLIGMEINGFSTTGLGVGIGGYFSEWMGLTLNIIYYPDLFAFDYFVIPLKLRLGGVYVYREFIFGGSFSTGIKPLLYLGLDEAERATYLEAEVLVTGYYFLNRADAKSFDLFFEVNSGITGSLFMSEEEVY